MPKTNAQEIKVIFHQLYDVFRGKSGYTDRAKDHPGWDKRTGTSKLSPWDRLADAVNKRPFGAAGYIFTILKQLMEDKNTNDVHPNFLLSVHYLDQYQKDYSTVIESIKIKWRDQELLFEAECQSVKTMDWCKDWTPQEVVHYVLFKEEGRFSDLFIFCHDRLEDVFNILAVNATFEYSIFPEVYDAIIIASANKRKKEILDQLKGTSKCTQTPTP